MQTAADAMLILVSLAVSAAHAALHVKGPPTFKSC